jgi:putative membrane protein
MPFHSGYGYYGTGDWLWSIFSTALFIVLVTLAIMLLVRAFSGPRRQGPGPAARPVGAPWWGPGGPGRGVAGPGVTRPAWGTAGNPEAETAERILAERYARGEISEEEYRSRLEVLRQAAAGWARPGPEQQSRQSAAPPVAESPGAVPSTGESPGAVPSTGGSPSGGPPGAVSASASGTDSGSAGQDQRTEEVR